MITPTIGRKVWYSPTAYGAHEFGKRGEQYFDATIVYVHDDRHVNLVITSHVGLPFFRSAVPLLQDGDAPRPEGGHALWMPYQVGQAKAAPAPDFASETIRRESARGLWKTVAARHAFAYDPESMNEATIDALIEFAQKWTTT